MAQVFIDSVREEKLERRRSLGKAPAMSSACHLRDSLPGAPGQQQNGGGALQDSMRLDRSSVESFQRNSQGARAGVLVWQATGAQNPAVCLLNLPSWFSPTATKNFLHCSTALLHLLGKQHCKLTILWWI